jgi:hypothetical protein
MSPDRPNMARLPYVVWAWVKLSGCAEYLPLVDETRVNRIHWMHFELHNSHSVEWERDYCDELVGVWKEVVSFSAVHKPQSLDLIFCWPCILLWSMVNDQLDAQFFSMYLFQFSICFEQPRVHHQEKQLYQYNLWYMSLCVGDRFVCKSERNFVLLMISARLLETYREMK